MDCAKRCPGVVWDLSLYFLLWCGQLCVVGFIYSFYMSDFSVLSTCFPLYGLFLYERLLCAEHMLPTLLVVSI